MGLPDVANLVRNPSQLASLFGFNPILIGPIVVDVLLSETPTFSYEITSHPVEAGLDVTDSRIKKPTGVILEGILSDTPFDIATIINSIVALVSGTGGFSFDRWEDKRDALYEFKESNEIIDIVTPLDVYTNMMVDEVRVDQTPDTSGGLFFRISAKEVRTVESEVTAIDPTQLPAIVQRRKRPKHDAASKKNAGKAAQGAKSAGDATGGQSSILNDLLGGLF